ncbi:MAG: peptidoglycan -binding protein [Proteobacteria bacterium]|nr:peptidoglycan -binding protein [Pseudomonadota bacterium]MBI3496535.1 peptidoglycan -binding protein [Pseudomonadota bacterium]
MDIWPGFVDALATLLMVIIFVLMVFVLAQFYLGAALTGRDEALVRLNRQISELTQMLSVERATSADLKLNLAQLAADLQSSGAQRDALAVRVGDLANERDALVARLSQAERDLAGERDRADKASLALREANRTVEADRAKITLQLADLERLSRDIEALKQVRAELESRVGRLASQLTEKSQEATQLRDRSKELEAKLVQSEETTHLAQREIQEREIRLRDLLSRAQSAESGLSQQTRLTSEAQAQVELLNNNIIALRQQLARIAAALEASESKSKQQELQISDLGQRLNMALASKVEELARYRSEFFGRLREALGDRPDIRIVGDRFVFQSEVLFDSGSAVLGLVGQDQLSRLAGTLIEISRKIPKEINWVLQIDGHTDSVPIATLQFPSNWELSAARAISVVKFLTLQGIPATRLAATGYGEYQPLDERNDEIGKRRNRRIELKLTSR